MRYEAIYGHKFRHIDLGTASLTGTAFGEFGYSVPLWRGSQPGDLLYKVDENGDGHVGIRVAGNMVAENSSYHWDGKTALGLRTLKEFGEYDVIVRLK